MEGFPGNRRRLRSEKQAAGNLRKAHQLCEKGLVVS